MKTGELLMIGFEGTALPEKFGPIIKKYGIGGFVLFERNLETPEQILSLNKSLYRLNDAFTPLIAVDQEGGRVQRLKPPFTHLPAAQKIGESYRRNKNIKHIYKYGGFIARELALAGFNMNLAPVLDLSDKKDGIIGDRAFSGTPLIAEEIGASLIAGMQDNGIIACAKHFPGATETVVDPHNDLPAVNTEPEMLRAHIAPFVHAIRNSVGAIMVSHTLFGGIDNMPASMSHRIINILLKKEAGFRGIAITDDIKMGAISKTYSAPQAVIRALNANADMVMIGNTTPDELEQVLAEIEKAAKKGIIKKEQLETSLRRIDIIKNEIGVKSRLVQSVSDILKVLTDKRYGSFLKKF